jgi:hypothetical protein
MEAVHRNSSGVLGLRTALLLSLSSEFSDSWRCKLLTPLLRAQFSYSPSGKWAGSYFSLHSFPIKSKHSFNGTGSCVRLRCAGCGEFCFVLFFLSVHRIEISGTGPLVESVVSWDNPSSSCKTLWALPGTQLRKWKTLQHMLHRRKKM